MLAAQPSVAGHADVDAVSLAARAAAVRAFVAMHRLAGIWGRHRRVVPRVGTRLLSTRKWHGCPKGSIQNSKKKKRKEVKKKTPLYFFFFSLVGTRG